MGGGLGSHVPYEDLGCQEYTILEIRQNILDTLVKKHPEVKCLLGDRKSVV